MIIGESQAAVKSNRPTPLDWLLAAVVAGAALLVYLRTLAPDVLPGDAGEFQLAAWRLGLSHATGYPLYMLVGSAWQHALSLFGINPAAALNSLSALFAALASAVVYLLLLDAPAESAITRRLVALLGASILAVNATIWSQAVVAEVYTLHALLLLLLLWTLQRAATLNHITPRTLIWPTLILGLSLAHHAMTILAAPAVLLYLFLVDRTWWRMSRRAWLTVLAALLGPLLLYAYIPLRSGPAATPWYHQSLGNETLSLYTGNLTSFVDFVTGRSISVGFHSPAEALAALPAAVDLWRQHFGILGLLLIVLGLYVLFERRPPFLWLTAGIAAAQQLFNLFYAIGDIAVYYTPLYAIAAVWAGYGAAGLCDGLLFRSALPSQSADAGTAGPSAAGWGNAGALIALVLFLLPIRAYLENASAVDQSDNQAARAFWQPILAALPAGDAILVTNDRDEIPPLFYFQYVEHSAPSVTALHPLIAHDARFADIGATLETALAAAGDTPVYLIKSMPGLEIKFDLEPAQTPLARVQAAMPADPTYAVNYPLGDLTLLGYDWQPSDDGARNGGSIDIQLHWRVDQAPAADYTTSVQLFDAAGDRIAQSDSPPGGLYYPTSLWKPGERLVEAHTLTLDAPADGETILQVGQYRSDDGSQPAPPLRMQTPSLPGAESTPLPD